MTKYIVGMMIALTFNGCIVGDVVALPFRITGAVVDVIAPDAIGDSISSTGDAIDTAIPF